MAIYRTVSIMVIGNKSPRICIEMPVCCIKQSQTREFGCCATENIWLSAYSSRSPEYESQSKSYA